MTTDGSSPRPLLLLFSLGLAVLIVGCSGSRSTTNGSGLPEGYPDHSAEEIRGHILQATDTLRRFSATARVILRSPEQDRRFNADIRQQRSDSLFMRFRLFGVEGGRLLLTADSVFFYDTRNHRLQVGSIEAARQIFPGPVASDRIFQNMLGVLAPSPATNWTVTANERRYYLADPTGQIHFTVDPRNWRVRRYVRESANGTVVDERLFSDFESVQGIPVPHRVIFRRPAEQLSAEITYENITLNPARLSLDLEVPDQIPREPLR